MAVIGIDINDVIRDFIAQFEYTYNKYMETDIKVSDAGIEDYDLIKYFPFKDEETMNRFLYNEASLEIFGHADEYEQSIITNLNRFIVDIYDFYGDNVVLLSREVMSAIPSTFFFLSKTACKCDNVRFVRKYADMWGLCDILITANPNVINSKPEDKVCVKVNRSFNNDCYSDYSVSSLNDVIDNISLYKEITSKK